MKVISGGQTGVDRAGLDAALLLEIEVGGWCPKGRRAEDGKIPDKYPLTETTSADYMERTKLNIYNSDGTLVLGYEDPTSGTLRTIQEAQRVGKPCTYILLGDPKSPASVVWDWVQQHHIVTLNIAGPRESKFPGIGQAALVYLLEALRPFAGWNR